MNFHRLREFREFGDPANAASVGPLEEVARNSNGKISKVAWVGCGSIFDLWAYFAYSTKYYDFAIVSAMNEDYLPMAVGIIVVNIPLRTLC